MQGNAKAGDIAILVDLPPRPRQLQPGLVVQYEFVGFPIGTALVVQRLYDRNAIDYVKLVLNPRLLDLLIMVAKPAYEVVCHLYLPIT
jgi:hypothetical protein